MKTIYALTSLHQSTFRLLSSWADKWLLGLLARITFLAVLALYYWNSALTKVGESFFTVSDSAYFQILGEEGMMAYDFDTANIPFTIDATVFLGTYMEFVLPALIIIGLSTRIASIGMVIFIAVQTWVDIFVHKVDAETIGALFDRHATGLVLDQRTLWVFLLSVLILKGAGAISLDHLLWSRYQARKKRPADGALGKIDAVV